MTVRQSELRARFVPDSKASGPGSPPFLRVFPQPAADPNTPLVYKPGAPRCDGDVVNAGGHQARGVVRPTGWVPTHTTELRAYAADRLRNTVPSWVPVPYHTTVDGQPHTEPLDVVREIEGDLEESHQAETDIPAYPWHAWYDWNFHVRALPPYQYLSTPRMRSTLECEWDTGTLGASRPGASGFNHAGPMYNDAHDWAWPMHGWHAWLAGRWIYDVGHADPPSRVGSAELHPCMAVATARSEGVMFDGQPYALPATQFMFFACRHGGYYDFTDAQWGGRDFTFLVELPPMPERPAPHPMMSTAEGGDATGQVAPRPWPPRPLVKIDHAPFARAHAPVGTAAPGVDHVLRDVSAPSGATDMTSQALITIPRGALSGSSSYGVIVSLGWEDFHQEQASQLYDVRVRFLWYEVLDGSDTDHYVRYGVNGRWRQSLVRQSLEGHPRLSLSNQEFRMLLLPTDALIVQMNGFREPTVGADESIVSWAATSGSARTMHALMSQAPSTRVPRVPGRAAALTWHDVAAASDAPSGAGLSVDTIAAAMVELHASTLGHENVKLSDHTHAQTLADLLPQRTSGGHVDVVRAASQAGYVAYRFAYRVTVSACAAQP